MQQQVGDDRQDVQPPQPLVEVQFESPIRGKSAASGRLVEPELKEVGGLDFVEAREDLVSVVLDEDESAVHRVETA